MKNANPKVDWYFEKAEKWQKEFGKMRAIALDCKLTEGLKWGHPCYMLGESNIVLIHGFKDYCAFLFFKGALLKDPKGILIQQTENVQAARQVRFTKASEIDKLKTTLKAYIGAAIAAEKSGAKVEMKKTAEFKMPDEFRARLAELPALKRAFEALTPGRQRAYLLHFSSAKQSKTRESRIENCIPQILDGMGLND
jgi:uncharacterized protein YdeI (YjbR/CyaY-like superfamily)